MKLFRFVALSAVAGALLAACGSGTVNDKVGAPGDHATTLRLGAVENESVPYAPQLEHFAAKVDELSNGAVHVDIVWDASGEFSGQSEVNVGKLVRDGQLDLALVPARAWDELGVTSMEALQTPMLVDDETLLATVIGAPVADELLAGLPAIGVQPIGLLPDSVRRPIGFDHPIITPADLQGARLRSPTSKVTDVLSSTLGYEQVEPSDVARHYDGAESAYIWAKDLPSLGTFTGNVALAAKANTLVANADAYDSWSDSTHDVLERAAADTRTHATSSATPEAQLAAGYCGAGGSVAIAAEDQLEQWRTATAPVVAALRADPTTSHLIDEITSIKNTQPNRDTIVACQHPTTSPSPNATPAGHDQSSTFPNGTYRTNSPLDGIVTFKIEDGTWQRITADGTLDCEATYTVEGGRIVLTTSTKPALTCGWPTNVRFLDAAWTLQGDQLRFTDIKSDQGAVAEFSLPWTRIG